MSRARPLQALLRSQTWERDKGVCSACKLDTVKLLDKLEKKRVKPTWLTPGLEGHNHRLNAVRYILELWGMTRSHRTLWICDHRVPLAIGGSDALHNCRTLCLRCDKRKTTLHDIPLIAKVRRKSKKFQKHSEVMASKFPQPKGHSE
jgi:5-methylcytosine-specific restriction endonuclease McrA